MKGATVELLKATDDWREADNVFSPTVVHLLHAKRLTPHHGHVVRAKVDTIVQGAGQLFVPLDGQPCNWEAEDGLVEVMEDGTATLILRNPTGVPIHLQEGDALGQLQTVQEVNVQGGEESRVLVGKVLVGDKEHSDRMEELWHALDVDDSSLSHVERAQLRQVIGNYGDTFALDNFELGRTEICKHAINTGDSPPIRQLPRRAPFTLRQKMDEMVEEMLEKGVITPSKSPWASPVVLVVKKDGSLRFCVDYRKLNAVTKLDVFPLPRIDDSLDMLAHTQYFTTQDLVSGNWLVPMETESKEKTAFCTPSGLYEFDVMQFGLCNTPATFQRLMESVLAGLARSSCSLS